MTRQRKAAIFVRQMLQSPSSIPLAVVAAQEILGLVQLGDLHSIFSSVCADFEAELVECDREDGRVHLLVNTVALQSDVPICVGGP
ncbi:hypothetical protein QFZ91_006015 [Paraburkholderia sp. JPY419]